MKKFLVLYKAPLASFELPPYWTVAAVRACRGFNTALDAAFYDVSTLREPFRIEGKKTMAYELFEQLGGELPDVVVYPTGGGTGLVGMWKALGEMEALGWLAKGARRPLGVSRTIQARRSSGLASRATMPSASSSSVSPVTLPPVTIR